MTNFFFSHTHTQFDPINHRLSFLLVIPADFSFYAVSATIPQPQTPKLHPPLAHHFRGAAPAARSFWREVENPLLGF
jgi:hypothetical protein